MLRNISLERLTERCEKLESYGFEIAHQDSRVLVNLSPDREGSGAIEVDFSSIAEDHFLSYAISKAYEEGLKRGKARIQEELRSLIGIRPVSQPTTIFIGR